MREVVLVVDVANVMGSRPDGWWRDRPAAAGRLLPRLAALAGTDVAAPVGPLPDGERGPDGERLRVLRVVAVVEGLARAVEDVEGVRVVRASGDGDTAIVVVAEAAVAAGEAVLVVTADRGLRARLPAGASATGPRWLLARLDRP